MSLNKVNSLIILSVLFYCFSISTAVEERPELPEVVSNLIDDENLSNWEAPEIIKRLYTVYYAGNDEDNRPIWIGELGKWDIRRAVEEGGEFFEAFDRYIDQMAQTILQTMVNSSTPELPVTEVQAIVDMEGYNMHQLSSVKTVSFILRKIKQLEPLLRLMETGFVVNTNYVAEMIITLVRPILGKIMERVEIHGLNKARWIPRLMKKFPKEALPEWYGGSKDFKPLMVLG